MRIKSYQRFIKNEDSVDIFLKHIKDTSIFVPKLILQYEYKNESFYYPISEKDIQFMNNLCKENFSWIDLSKKDSNPTICYTEDNFFQNVEFGKYSVIYKIDYLIDKNIKDVLGSIIPGKETQRINSSVYETYNEIEYFKSNDDNIPSYCTISMDINLKFLWSKKRRQTQSITYRINDENDIIYFYYKPLFYKKEVDLLDKNQLDKNKVYHALNYYVIKAEVLNVSFN